ncbi:hypothetical protein B1H10_08630 [candidate division KSB1 bacterium 4484_188]|nr:MAG: hypothetical protein B1H10_08630 [candidate division KSB1 bacterium 4484_188]
MNEKWCQITGLSSEEAFGEGWAKTLHPDDRERVFKEWHSAAREEVPFQSEYRFQHPGVPFSASEWKNHLGIGTGKCPKGGKRRGYRLCGYHYRYQ